MTFEEIVSTHTSSVLTAHDAVMDGAPDMRMSLIWLVNLTETWVDQTRAEAQEDAEK